MISRVVYRRQRGRRLLSAIGVIGLLAGTLLAAGTVLAVHDAGVFQLDGDASSATNTNLGVDDWDHVCYQAAIDDDGLSPADAATRCGTSTGTSAGETGSSWANDGSLNASIFTGGGSKDPQDISSWAWKDGAGGLPDKDNLLHSFAARYSLPPSTHCPAGTAATCELLYFGSDRYDNSGDAQQGFWFFQNKITLGTNAVGGGTGFVGVHKTGDVLVISDFSNGGTTSTITVYKWDPTCTKTGQVVGAFVCGDANLLKLATSDNANCATVPDADGFCGLVNSGTITMPWSFTDKSATADNGALNGEFYEGGINLSLLGLGSECFSSIASETRSSTSTTATLKDFVLGQFAVCGATISTTPSAGVTEATSVSPGTAVTDLATVQGTGTSNPPTPTGDVTFFICGPTATDATTNCTTGGTQVGDPVALADASPPAGKATATSAEVNTSGSPLAPGRYCFRAEWPGDSNYTDGPYVHFGSNNSECFIVRQIPTSTVTTPSDSSGAALTSPVALGTTLYDKAVVTGTAAGGTPTGTVSFFLCDPSQVTGAAGSEVCPSNAGSAVGTPTLTAIANSSPPAASALSNGTAANTAGVWCFRATYNPSGSTYLTSSDGTHTECVTVSPAGTTTVTTPQVNGAPISGAVAVNTSVTDHAVVTGTTAGGTPTGTITFYICDPTQTTGAAGSEVCATGGTQLNTATASAVANSSPPQSQADSTAVVADTVGTWCFRAEYTATVGGNYTDSSDARHSECFTVNDSTSGTSAQTWLPNDSATITSAGGTALNGTLSFTLYSGTTCSGTILRSAETFTLTDATSPVTRNTTNSTFTVSASTSTSWLVQFTSTDPLVSGSSKCETTSLTINNNPAP